MRFNAKKCHLLKVTRKMNLLHFLCFSHDASGAGPVWTPGVTVGMIYKEDHYTLLHTKYESSGPCGFGEEIFLCFPIVTSLWELSFAKEIRVARNLMQTFFRLNASSDKIRLQLADY